MSVVGVAMVKDEADVIAGVVAHMCNQVDAVIVADNGSTDGTLEILWGLLSGLPVTLIDDPEVAYRQSDKMTALANRAAADGAQWIVPFDADEIWYSTSGRPIREVLGGMGADDPAAVRVPILNHLRTSHDVKDPDPFWSMVYRQHSPQDLGKVAFRWEPGATIHQGNHGVTLPAADPCGLIQSGVDTGQLELRHFPIRSADHLIRKARNGGAAYAAIADSPPTEGGHWKGWYSILQDQGEDALREAYWLNWFYPYPDDAGLVRNPAPYRRPGHADDR